VLSVAEKKEKTLIMSNEGTTERVTAQTVIVKSDEAQELHRKLGEAIDEIENLETKLREAKRVRNEASAKYWALVDEAVEAGGSEHFEIRNE
tara:strand:+ start:1614 stop:1889 length:276 start_codon:yes stop_codon:yes gene_type:complete